MQTKKVLKICVYLLLIFKLLKINLCKHPQLFLQIVRPQILSPVFLPESFPPL